MFRGFLFLAVMLGSLTACTQAEAGFGKFGADPTVTVLNGNDWQEEDADIRVWLLTEEQITNPPTTAGQAREVVAQGVSSPFGIISFFDNEPGNYFLVASNANYFAGLSDEDSFTPGEDFSVFPFEIRVGEDVELMVRNTDTPTLLPETVRLD